VRVINNTGASVTINSVAVHVDTCTYTGWPSATLSPGDQLIVTQLVSGASLPTDGCTGPTPTHMDTSDIGPAGSPYSNNCTRDGIIPSVDVTVNGTTMTYIDTGQVLNTGGFDLGECPHDTDEATPWTQINPSTNVLLPSNGATLTGSQYLDASASDTGGVAKVEFHLTGGTLNNALIATATPTFYGWLAGWNTATVANGTYTLQSVAYDAPGASGTSTGVTITVNNPPTTTVIIPSNGATLSGTAATLDAIASNATSVEFVLFGGGYWDHVIGTATPTYYGWLYSWNTKTVANGSYVLFSEAFNSGGSAFSPGVNITVTN
jgi:hypothetical protein